MRKIYINGTVYTVTNGNAEAFVEENGNQGEDKPNNSGGSTDKEIKIYYKMIIKV